METPIDRLKAALADRYVIARDLSSGGMATVLLAAHCEVGWKNAGSNRTKRRASGMSRMAGSEGGFGEAGGPTANPIMNCRTAQPPALALHKRLR